MNQYLVEMNDCGLECTFHSDWYIYDLATNKLLGKAINLSNPNLSCQLADKYAVYNAEDILIGHVTKVEEAVELLKRV